MGRTSGQILGAGRGKFRLSSISTGECALHRGLVPHAISPLQGLAQQEDAQTATAQCFQMTTTATDLSPEKGWLDGIETDATDRLVPTHLHPLFGVDDPSGAVPLRHQERRGYTNLQRRGLPPVHEVREYVPALTTEVSVVTSSGHGSFDPRGPWHFALDTTLIVDGGTCYRAKSHLYAPIIING